MLDLASDMLDAVASRTDNDINETAQNIREDGTALFSDGAVVAVGLGVRWLASRNPIHLSQDRWDHIAARHLVGGSEALGRVFSRSVRARLFS